MNVLLVFLLVLGTPHFVSSASSKPVSTLLHSYWSRTSMLIEASEFMYDYDEGMFWRFVDATKDISTASLTQKELYDSVLDHAEGLLPPSVYSLFIFSLSLHTHSPAVEMYNQIAKECLSIQGGVDCSVFVELEGQLYCFVDELVSRLDSFSVNGSWPLYEFDHSFLSINNTLPTAILYGEMGTNAFLSMHVAMATLAQEGKVNYVLRHYEAARPLEKTVLSGYGVELAVKNTEYKAVDDSKVKGDESRTVDQSEVEEEVEGFVFSTLKSLHPDLKEGFDEFRTHLMHGSRELPELKPWQLQDLGFQAAQRVMSTSPQLALKVVKDIAQNIPMQAKTLNRLQVSKELRNEITANQRVLSGIGVSPGDSVLLMNGIVIQKDNMDIFQLFEVLLSEVRLLERLSSLSILPLHHHTLLTLPVHPSGSKTFPVDVRNDSVVFINDLETDKYYRSWPKSLREFLQPAYPGSLRQVAKNVFNIVFMVDPMTSQGAEMIEYIKLFLDHHVPARLGIVLLPSDDVGVALARGFSFLVEHKSPREAFRWIVRVLQTVFQEDGPPAVENVLKSFETSYNPQTLANINLEQVFGEMSDALWKKSLEFFSSKGFDTSPQVLVNGVQINLDEDLETAIVTMIQSQMMPIQQAIFTKQLTDHMNVYDYLLNKSNVLKRVNKHLVTGGKQFDLSAQIAGGHYNTADMSDKDLAAIVARGLHYFNRGEGEFTTKEVSLWIVGDFSNTQTRKIALESLNLASTTDQIRVALIPSIPSPYATLMEACLQSQSEVKAWSFILQLLSLQLDNIEEAWHLTEELEINTDKLREAIENLDDDITSDHVAFASHVLNLGSGETGIISNGRLLGPLRNNERFLMADFELLLEMESSQYSEKLTAIVDELEIDGLGVDDDTSSFRSDLVMKLASFLLSQPLRRRLTTLPEFKMQHSVLHLPALDSSVEMTVVAIINPLSTDAQKLAPLLQVLQVALPVDITLILNPTPKLAEMPVNSFYRYVLEPELSFAPDGSPVAPVSVFNDLPQSPLLTLHLDVPHSWLVEVIWSPHDLDNIHLDGVSNAGVYADFELKNVLVEGQCFDARTDHPIPGLEYVLGTSSHPELFDTIVMANLGYFQLKAGPGAWTLKLRDGRSNQIYAIQNHVGGDQIMDGSISIVVNSFRGTGVVVYVAKQPGMESVELLVDEQEGVALEKEDKGNIWSTLSNLVSGVEEKAPAVDGVKVSQNETINIFSVASGHLYERFLRIMMLSVIKQTENPVKFWFLKNFLSPTFKDFIPTMAAKYEFEYELVEYKWPRWLKAQTQKQRIIWGYKILFLDVLFPLSVKKIIFVDADQIVRTDLREILEVPLEGAPYAYTPFCDSRPDMAGFRFWDGGYWKNHLGNRRYHISALYVIDLLRFRQLAAGDRLRGQYQALSQDPNSLSNLDQDLPNNMIHAVPIKSLPQDWLWCETWCSQESKKTAKTIDLCNNPLTKEPKLQAAARIVPEWTSYDNEIKQFMEEVNEADTTPNIVIPTIAGDGDFHTEL